ncbi:chloroplastic import inner membrane translocase subunit HP30-2 isoform X1 [Andrographis paniculata]|uniref:chloroplastic import inner membrane translocase subunit HP30-2 isoform X1 n=1 Tax=Andrographis paniculata TaxID=175694 RepID=UPI0021E70559|nr:chloroplastic import inner membrane translocase subunit HP30-2 isoform X1 [Andrographis paniculata]
MGEAELSPIARVQARVKDVNHCFKGWLAQQPLPVEAAVVSTTSAAIGAFMGTVVGMTTSSPKTSSASVRQLQGRGTVVQARNFAVMKGVNAGVSCIMRRIRGKEDIQSSMVAAFSSGAMFSLVSGSGGGQNQAANAVSSGIFFALVQGGLFQLGLGGGQ